MTTTANIRQPDRSTLDQPLPPARKVSAVVIGLWRFVRRFFVKPKITFCPQCHQEQLRFWPTGGGEGWGEYGRSGWVDGDAKCKCGFRGYHSDSWP